MIEGATAVLDASALLAWVFEETGGDRVELAIGRGTLVSSVNWAEALSRMAELGEPIDVAEPRVRRRAAILGTLSVLAFDETHAKQTAQLRMPTKSLGLSLADRACLALGKIHHLPVLTTDRAWRSLRISVKIEVIR